jgi:hypothetical protein
MKSYTLFAEADYYETIKSMTMTIIMKGLRTEDSNESTGFCYALVFNYILIW